MAIWKWYIDAEVNMSSVKKETAKLKKELKKSGSYLENDIWKKGNKAVWWLTSSFKKLWGVLAWVFSVVAIVSFTKKLFQLWSDATEIGSKFDTVFWWIEKTAWQTFDNLADAVWRSKLELRKFWSDLGDVLKPLWFTTDEAFKLSENITKLAIDVASFNNVSDAQAVNAFKSALTWEREALKSLWIVISEADLKTEAYTSWIAKQWSTLTKQQKTLATYNLLLKNTSDAQWDAVRTWWSFANQLKRLQWVISDVLAQSWRDIAQQSAIVLSTLWKFINDYWSILIWVTINTVTTIWWILVEATKWFKSLFDILIWNTEKAWESQITFTKIFLYTINFITAWISTIATAVKSVWNIIWWVFLATKNTIEQMWRVIADVLLAIWWGIKWLVTGNFDLLKKSLTDVPKALKKIWKVNMQIVETSNEEIWGNFKKLASKLDKSFNDIKNSGKDSNKDLVDNYSTSFDSLTWIADKYSKVWWNIVNKSNNKQRKSTNELKNKLDQLKNEYSKVEKQIKELDKVSEDYAKNSKKYNSDIIDDVRKLNKELDDRKQKLDDEISSIELDSKNKLAERYVDIKEREKEVKKEIQDINNEDVLTTENLQKRIELEKELKNLEKEKASINSNVWQDTLNEAERKSWLSETDRILEEEKLKKEQAKKDYDREKEKLDSLLKINQAFFNLKKLDQQQLDEFQQAETFKNWSTEEQELFLKLAREKVSLTDQANYKLELERQINNEMINLSNLTLEVQLENNNKLDKSYDDIIAKINKAIIKQRELSALWWTAWYKDWGYTGYSSGGFTWSGDSNKVAWVVHAGEWVAPAWMLDSLWPVFDKLETMRSWWSTTKTINKTQNNNITVNSQFEAENFLDYANWKL